MMRNLSAPKTFLVIMTRGDVWRRRSGRFRRSLRKKCN